MSDLSEGITKEALRPPEKFHPSKSYTFPKRTFGQGKDQQSFRSEWCTFYAWLHYDPTSDAVFVISA